MSWLFYWFVASVCGSLNFRVFLLKEKEYGKWLKGILWNFAAVAPILFAYFFFAMPSMTGPLGGFLKVLSVVWPANWLITTVIVTMFETGYNLPKEKFSSNLYGGLGMAAMGLFVLFLGAMNPHCFANDNLRNMLEVEKVETSDDLAFVDVAHIREVGAETAKWKGDKQIGSDANLGAQFEVGEYTIERVKGELWWVAPLEFRGFWKWTSQEGTPGYVMVSAEDNSKPVVVKSDLTLRYMPSAFWGTDLERLIYMNGFAEYELEDFTFELDDELKPWWVVTALKPSMGWTAETIEGVVIVNPETGDLRFYSMKDIPEWVDRVVPAETAQDRISWWGMYVHGWWNQMFSEKDVLETTEKMPTLVYGEDGSCYWFSGLTSPNKNESALVSYALVNSRTGKTKIVDAGGANEDAVVKVVNGEFKFKNWTAGNPIPYLIYSRLTWVVPVLDQNNNLKQIALVDGSATKVSYGETKAAAFASYRKHLAETKDASVPSNEFELKTATGTVVRIEQVVENGSTTFYLTMDSRPEMIFTGSAALSAELPLTHAGDTITITFRETEEALVPVETFDNDAIQSRKPKIKGAEQE